MDDRLARLVSALGPVMNPVQAEGFLHVAAFTRSRRPEALTYEDWPAVEDAVREALDGLANRQRIDEVCERLRLAFLQGTEGPLH